MKDEEFDDVIATNLRIGVFRLSRGVMRGMMKARSPVASSTSAPLWRKCTIARQNGFTLPAKGGLKP